MNPRYKNVVGRCLLPASGGTGRYRSQHERRGSAHWGLDPDVSDFVYQQPVIHYRAGGKPRRYTGDTLVRFKSGHRPLVVEYKLAESFQQEPGLHEYYAVIREKLKGMGLDFVILQQADLLDAGFRNKEFIVTFQNNPVSPFEGELMEAMVRLQVTTLQCLLQQVRLDHQAQLSLVPVVWRLVATKRLFIDFDQTPSRESSLSTKPISKSFYESLSF